MTRHLTIKDLRSLHCNECGTKQGTLHADGCRRERCSLCGGQRVFCGHHSPIASVRRLPFIDWTNVCAACGELDPELFDVPKRVWRFYIEPFKRDEVICLPCWQLIVDLTDCGKYQASYGGPVALHSDEWKRRYPDALARVEAHEVCDCERCVASSRRDRRGSVPRLPASLPTTRAGCGRLRRRLV
jgi:hypothetical protein